MESEFKQQMMMISLNRDDRMRLISCPSYVVTLVEEEIREHWEEGLQDSKEKDGFWEFKLSGYPWWADGEETVKSRYIVILRYNSLIQSYNLRYLIANMITRLKTLGWEVAGTMDVSRRLNDKAVFIFRQCQPQVANLTI